ESRTTSVQNCSSMTMKPMLCCVFSYFLPVLSSPFMNVIISSQTILKKAMGNPPPLKHHDYCSSSSVSSETASSPSSEPSTSSPSVSSRSSSFCGGTMLTSVSSSSFSIV